MKKYQNFLILMLAGGILLFAILSLYKYYQSFDASKLASQAKNNTAGTTAPNLVLSDLQGRSVRLSDYRGKIVVLNFWATWCPPCREELPEVSRTAEQLASSSDVVLWTVNLTDGSRETESTVRNYLTKNQITLPILLDQNGQAANAYHVTSIPTTFIIDQQGIIKQTIRGSSNQETIMAAVDKLR